MTLTDFQVAKLREWAEYRETNYNDGCFPYGIGIVDAWIERQIYDEDTPFPTAEQMTPRRSDFGLPEQPYTWEG